jgi:hypothetical protein
MPTDDQSHTHIHKQKKRERASRLPSDWQIPEEWQVWAKEAKPDWSQAFLLKTASDFKDYWLAAPNGLKLDWMATWRKWVRNTNDPKGAAPKQDLGHYR